MELDFGLQVQIDNCNTILECLLLEHLFLKHLFLEYLLPPIKKLL